MKGFVKDIEAIAVKNGEFRRVLYTAKNCQLVVMALEPKGEIGAEAHKLDQFFRVADGSGEAILFGVVGVGHARHLGPAGHNVERHWRNGAFRPTLCLRRCGVRVELDSRGLSDLGGSCPGVCRWTWALCAHLGCRFPGW